MRILRKLFFSFLIAGVLSGCAEDMDDVITPAGSLEIKDFIWKGMNNVYLYKGMVPDLANDRFSNQKELEAFLKRFASPEDLFYEGLVAPQDEFSFLVPNYIELEQLLDGISISNGMQFGLKKYSTTSEMVFGYVRYVLPGTSAEAMGIKRGDIFNSIDGQQLTLDNYSQLLESSSYTIGLARFEGTELISSGQSVKLEKQEYSSNPVYLKKILETNSGKAGYLMYNAFTGTFDSQLNEAFALFKSEAISHLIIDLRYNGGGSVETAVDLASMVTGQFEGKIFTSQEWNEEYQAYYEKNDPEGLVDLFNSTIRTGERINSLGLDKLYVLTSPRTASASELLINGLTPYIKVVQIGEATTGKFQASITLYDSPDFRRPGANPGHFYAIQPLVYKSKNALGVTDYFEGLFPDIEISEDIRNLGELGNPKEPLLQAALNDIQGIPQNLKRSVFKFPAIKEIGSRDPLFSRMYSEKTPPRLGLP